jgi:hypothetical protein
VAAWPVLEPEKTDPLPTISTGRGMVRASRSSGYATLAPTATACIGLLRAAAGDIVQKPLAPASGLMRWRTSLAVSATLVLSCSTVSVRPARVCSVSRLICCSERVSVCGIVQSVANYLRRVFSAVLQISHFVAADERNDREPKPRRRLQRLGAMPLEFLKPVCTGSLVHLAGVRLSNNAGKETGRFHRVRNCQLFDFDLEVLR